MSRDWDERNDALAAGANCPMPDCGALAISYEASDGKERGGAELWEFTCPRCSSEFTVPEGQLIFKSVPKEWLLSKVQVA